MEIKIFQKATTIIKKYKYAILIFLIGFVLMMLPNKEKTEIAATVQQENKVAELPLEQRLADILCQVEGAGDVRVILTVSVGEETLFQEDNDNSQRENEENISKDTVIVSDADHNETGLIRQIIPAVYQGAVVVCQGADNPTVRFKITDAVSKLTGLGTNRISILKMK